MRFQRWADSREPLEVEGEPEEPFVEIHLWRLRDLLSKQFFKFQPEFVGHEVALEYSLVALEAFSETCLPHGAGSPLQH